MSTRGYLTVVDNKKNIQSAAYHRSDSYPSHLGLIVLEAIEQYRFPQFVEDLREEYPEDLDMVEGIRRDWYIRSAQNKDDYFVDYCYEFNPNRQELNLFHFGEKALTIPYNQIPLYRFLFEHEEKLYYPLSLDERSMALKKDFYKEIRSMVKAGASIHDFQEIMDRNPSVLYLSYGRMKDPWDMTSQSFNKDVRDSSGNKLKFHISESFGKIQLYVQTPFIRAPIPHRPIQSAGGAEKFLAEIVRERPDDIRATMGLFKELESYKKSLDDIYSNVEEPLNARADHAQEVKLDMLAKLKAAKAEHRILGDTDRLLEREVNDASYNRYRRAKSLLEKQEEKAALSETLTDAAHRAESGNNQPEEPVITVPER